MANLPEKVRNQRMKVQLQSIESPSEFPGRRLFQNSVKNGSTAIQDKVLMRLNFDNCENITDIASPITLNSMHRPARSPMTDLAFDLKDTCLSSGKSPDIKKKLTMDYDSSPSPCSSTASHPSLDDSTPLSTITNKPKVRSGRSLTKCYTEPSPIFSDSNKENVPLPFVNTNSPLKNSSPYKPYDSPLQGLRERRAVSYYPIIQSPNSVKAQPCGFPNAATKSISQKRPLFKILDNEDDNSRDSGYASQPTEEVRVRKKSRCEPSSMTDIYANCSPSKDEEDGVTPICQSPSNKSSKSDGFDVACLFDIPEEEKEDSPSNKFSDLMNSQLLMRPNIQRSFSMDDSSPISRNSQMKTGFKRPELPSKSGTLPMGIRKRSNAQVERSVSYNGGTDMPRPVIQRSQSECSIKKSCELKDTEDALPDGCGKYVLPSATGLSNRHPNLRSVTCDTVADLIGGRHDDFVNSFRIIDVRYKFEYDGGHIEGAENWVHGEDEEFLSAFLPNEALTEPPVASEDKTEKRNIIIFHCEFSSQRAPDFYNKLRERDRTLNAEVFPALHYPECYLLHGGYKEFYINYPDLCTGKYTEMVDPNFKNELRMMRAKSKSWSGGTVARTGTMSRKFRR